jgi:hypothetical protein
MPKKPGRDKDAVARTAFRSASKFRKTYSGIVKTPRPINELLEQNALAARITCKLSVQKSWTEWLREVVPPELATHIVYAVPKESDLVVFADTSAWGVRLRYAAAGLAEAIRARDPAIIRTQVRVQPPSTPSPLIP